MVVMESFAEGQDAEDPDIGSALPGARDDESAFAPGVRRVADGPVADDPGRSARANADGHAAGPEDKEDADREKEHVDGPRPLQESEPWVAQHVGREPRLGGIGEWLAVEIARHTGKETRSLVLGHLQRGGQPTSFDRLLGTRFGAAAMRLVAEGRFRTMVALHPPRVLAVPLAKAVGHGRMKKVPLGSDILQSARDMGIGFGD